MSTTSYISLFELQSLIKQRLREGLLSSYWVAAEVSEVKENGSGHCYLTLTENDERGQIPRARVNGVIWSGRYGVLKQYFMEQTGRNIERGMKLLVRVEVNYHELYGLSVVIRDIDPTYTLGDIAQRRQRVINELKERGYWDLNRSLEMERPAQRIAIISSSTAAGYSDFMDELLGNEQGYIYHCELFNSIMQGGGAEYSIITSLEEVESRADEFDVAIIIRGGGAESDLACFDSLELSISVATMSLPIVTGIGHEKDISVVDMIAAVSLKTPTAVARYFIDSTAQFEGEIDGVLEYLKDLTLTSVQQQRELIANLAYELQRVTNESMRDELTSISSKWEQVRHLSKRVVEGSANYIEQCEESLQRSAKGGVELSTQRVDRYLELLRIKALQRVSLEGQNLETKSAIVEGFNPKRILESGYALARVGAKVLRSKDEVKEGDMLELTLKDGIIESKITKIL